MNAKSLEELKMVWQTLKLDSISDETDMQSDVFDKIKKHGIKQRNIYYFKIFVTIVSLSVFFISVFYSVSLSLINITGVVLLSLALIIYLLIYKRKYFDINSLDMALPSREFVSSVIAKIREGQKIHRFYTPLLILEMMIGINILLYGQITPVFETIKRHVILTLPFLIALYRSIKFSEKNYEKNILPLLKMLESFN